MRKIKSGINHLEIFVTKHNNIVLYHNEKIGKKQSQPRPITLTF